ncbi:aminopeptidase N-like isoform X2 [Linepithema humile]|uniref:aminopeptidase N-like isoform X2 n=1 Tax=Linepithema humile TaxID=83485 RepID=UPI00351F1E18
MLNATGVDVITAQQLFPCWDKIVFNATYKISIKHHKNYAALSNMPIQATENDKLESDMMWTHFEKSTSIFIEHIKVVITSFTNTHTSVGNVTFWSRKNMTGYLHLAECIAQQVLYFLKRQNAIDKLPKIDYVAFWDDQHNTTETWGLILHREADIIDDKDSDPIQHEIKVAYLITYEIISLCYSDVFLWSKTGFVTLFATHILHQLFRNSDKSSDIMNLFIAKTQRQSFLFDTPSNALNVSNEMNSLSYSTDHIKSSNIWRMLYHLITPDMFWTGIRTYVNNKQYNQTNNLWNIMQTVLHTYSDNSDTFIIKELISVWINKKYYPVLYVTRNQFTNNTRFQYLTTFIDEDTTFIDKVHLPTFVTYTTKSIMNFHEIFVNKSFWLSPQKSVTLSENFKENDWIIVNLQQTGYYRVNYNTENWLELAKYMNSTKYINIHVLNRAQIIDDAFHFLLHKQLDYVMFWKISAFLSRDTNYVAWYPMFKAFEHMTLITPIKDAKNLKKEMQEILKNVLQKIGYNAKLNENALTECLREEVVKWACIVGDKKCREVANKQMMTDLHSESDTFITQSVSRTEWMYCNGFASANNTIWYDVFKKWIETYKHTILEYLTCCTNPTLIRGYLSVLTENEFFKRIDRNKHVQIYLLIIAKHAENDIAFNFVLQRLNTHIYMYSTSNTQSYQIAIFIIIITHQHDVNQFKRVRQFAKVLLREERLLDAVKEKVKKRIDEYGKQVRNYGVIGLRFRLT